MPGHLTHNKSYLDVYKLLPEKMKRQYASTWEAYKLFAQGHDFLLLYMFLHLPQYPELHRKLTVIEEDIQDFAIHYISSLQKTGKSAEAVLFLYGYLTHHFLDAKLHPLIVYGTGDLKTDKNASALHLLVENMIDAYLLKKDGVDPKGFPTHSLVTSDRPLTGETRAILDYSFEKTYGYQGLSKPFADYNRTARTFFKALRYDPKGRKTRWFRPLDFLLKGVFKPSVLPFYFDGTECLPYLNTDKKPWAYPADASRISEKSFDELYSDGVIEIAQMLSLLDEAIAGNATEAELRAIIPNISSIHGCESVH